MTEFLDSLAHDLPGLHAELGRVVTYAPAVGDPRDVLVIVGETSEVEDADDIERDGTRVWLRVIATKVPELAQGDGFTIGEVAYTVNGVEEKRQGLTLVTLTRA